MINPASLLTSELPWELAGGRRPIPGTGAEQFGEAEIPEGSAQWARPGKSPGTL